MITNDVARRSAPPRPAPVVATNWLAVATIVGSGVIAAFQVGKAVIAVPALRAELGLSLPQAAWLMAVFALLGVVGAIPVGAIIGRLGARRLLLAGLLIVLGASAGGALARSFAALLSTRVLEGIGVVLITICAPALLRTVIADRDRDLAFALWSGYMPLGMAMILAAGGWIQDWRHLWWGTTVLAALAMVGVVLMLPGRERGGSAPSWKMVALDAWTTVRNPGSALIAALFATYTLQYFAVFSFLPVLLIERVGMSVAQAGFFSALAAAANAFGTLVAGIVLTRQWVPRWVVLAGASAVMGLSGACIFALALPHGAVLALCVVFAGVGGMLPSTLLGSAPLLAPTPRLAPVALGLTMQGSNLGQVLGPLAVGASVQAFGWPSAAFIAVTAALLGIALACQLRPRFRRV